jgi:hypothetical protein
LLGDQLFERLDLDIQKRGQRADIDDILEELPLARLAIFLRADIGERHAEHDDILAQLPGRNGS